MRNPTMSKDGIPRVDIKIAWRMDLRALANVLASCHYDDNDLDDMPLGAIRDEIRAALKSNGDDGWIYWTDHVDDQGEIDDIRTWAIGQARRAFPELAAAQDRAQTKEG